MTISFPKTCKIRTYIFFTDFWKKRISKKNRIAETFFSISIEKISFYHIRSTNHNGNKPVSKATHECRHNYKEQHKQTMCCNQHIIELPIPCQNTRSYITLFHSNQQTHCCCNNSNPSCKNKVHHSDVFCVCTTKPSNEQIIPFIRSVFHCFQYKIYLDLFENKIWTKYCIVSR